MKTVFMVIAAIIIAFNADMANAQFAAGGGFEGPRAPSMVRTTVKEALKMWDESIVVLVGNIINSLGNEKYTFRDETGEVVIEIDDDDWRGVTVTPNDTLEIVGEIDKEFIGQTKIEVKSFKVVR